jgi:transposase
MSGAKKRQSYTREYKLEAVRRATEEGRSVPQVARELGIRTDLLRSWKRQSEGLVGQDARDVFPGQGNVAGEEGEVRRLRRELAIARQEVEFLKKAATYFARESR